MKVYSTTTPNHFSTFREATLAGLAPDRGLYMPCSIPKISDAFLKDISNRSFAEIAIEMSNILLEGEVPASKIEEICISAFNFEVPLVPIAENISTLELFHGPTLAFKDFAARYMAQMMSYFNAGEDKELTILVATSGDTGGAVAHGFYCVDGIRVVILYPSGKVSDLQEKQLTTLGENISALEVDGTFDDCQRMVKDAFVDEDLSSKLRLSSANSINISRLIPQSFFHAYGASRAGCGDELTVSVPSGNFGNLTAGVLAKKMGIPIRKFVAATNVNDVVPSYLENGEYQPIPSKETISNAMDVGDPSNFVRLEALYDKNIEKIREDLRGFRYTDEQTRAAIKEVFDNCGYIMDPHGAIGYLGLKDCLEKEGGSGYFLETAHPSKFKDSVEAVIAKEVEIPSQLTECMTKEKQARKVSADFESLRDCLLST